MSRTSIGIQNTVLITGASAGIGEAFAREYAARGYDLVLTARRADRLNTLAEHIRRDCDVSIKTIKLDLSEPDAPAQLLAILDSHGIEIDVLVNNAGYGLPGTYLASGWETQKQSLQLMFITPLELCHKLLGPMKRRKYGRIINVCSLVSYTPGSAGHTLYGPIKVGLMRFSEALNAEFRGTNIHITALCPGLTLSEFHDVNGMRKRVSRLPRFIWQTSEDVAEAGIRAVEVNKPVKVPGLVNKFLASLARILPDPLARAAARVQTKLVRQV